MEQSLIDQMTILVSKLSAEDAEVLQKYLEEHRQEGYDVGFDTGYEVARNDMSAGIVYV